MMYNNPQGDGLFLVFKFNPDGSKLDTGSHTGSYQYKGPARTYNTIGKARAQWTRYHRDGYTSRVAQVDIHDGAVVAEWVDQDWQLKPEKCGHRQWISNDCGRCGRHVTCVLDKGHDGLHSSTRRKKCAHGNQ